MQLREYQKFQMVNPARVALRSGNSVVISAPTGSGKTACIAFICEQAVKRGLTVLIISHKGVIQRQIMKTLTDFGVDRGGIASGMPILKKPVQVAMVGTLVNRMDGIPIPNLLIIDEFHHCHEGNQWGKVVRYYQSKNPKLQLIGFTATPQGRTDGKGLRPFANAIVQGPQPMELVRQGWLTWLKMWDISGGVDFKMTRGDFDKGQQAEHFSKTKIIGGVIDHYMQHLDGLPTLVSCVSIKHAEEMAKRYEEYFKGRGREYRAVAIQGGKKHEKQMLSALAGLGSGSVQIVTFCDVIGEGVDVPVCMGLQMLRKTTSLVLYLQFVGRILRPVFNKGFNQYTSTAEQRLHAISAGIKPFAKLLDHVGNRVIHGHPMLNRVWGLDDTRKGRKAGTDKELVTTMCDGCLGVWPGKPHKCPDCGADLVKQELHKEGKKTPQEIAGVLTEYTPGFINEIIALQDALPRNRTKVLMGKIFAANEGEKNRLRAANKALGYKDGFFHRIWRMRMNKRRK